MYSNIKSMSGGTSTSTGSTVCQDSYYVESQQKISSAQSTAIVSSVETLLGITNDYSSLFPPQEAASESNERMRDSQFASVPETDNHNETTNFLRKLKQFLIGSKKWKTPKKIFNKVFALDAIATKSKVQKQPRPYELPLNITEKICELRNYIQAEKRVFTETNPDFCNLSAKKSGNLKILARLKGIREFRQVIEGLMDIIIDIDLQALTLTCLKTDRIDQMRRLKLFCQSREWKGTNREGEEGCEVTLEDCALELLAM